MELEGDSMLINEYWHLMKCLKDCRNFEVLVLPGVHVLRCMRVLRLQTSECMEIP